MTPWDDEDTVEDKKLKGRSGKENQILISNQYL